MREKLFETKYIFITSLLSASLLFSIENFLEVNYLVKTLSKIFLLTVIPLFLVLKVKKQSVSEILRLDEKNNLKYGVILGIPTFFLILGLFWIVQFGIDFDMILEKVDTYGITKTNFFLVAVYVCLGNALLEEFYFRGYIFMNMYENGNKRLAYIYPSILFSLYHSAIFITWFNPLVMLLVFLGLGFAGWFFSYVNTLSKNFLNSYIIHIFADIALMVIGYYVLFIV